MTTLTFSSRTMPISNLGGDNCLPKFNFQFAEVKIKPDQNLIAEELDGFFLNGQMPLLPYLVQDQYDRSQAIKEMKTVCLENKYIKATFYPEHGGRLASLFDKENQRELLLDNPVFQPANLAIRNAWFSGGVEWNGPIYGHSMQTCDAVFMAKVVTEKGPILRIYEFDRTLETTWQVDILLPENDRRLWVHVTCRNPHDHPLDYYWWSNIAIPLTDETRVLSPADYVVCHSPDQSVTQMEFPLLNDVDVSYASHSPNSESYFFRKPVQNRPWITALDGNGYGLLHSSTKALSGRKFFVWGQHRGGKRWMDFLSEPGKGSYLEIQAGITPTQLQTKPLAAQSNLSWTECYSALSLDAEQAHHQDYQTACDAVQVQLIKQVPDSELEDFDQFLRENHESKITEVLTQGKPWGMLEEKRRGSFLSKGLEFDTEIDEQSLPWFELLEQKGFSLYTLEHSPKSWCVSSSWIKVLEEIADESWLKYLYLAIAYIHSDHVDKAVIALERSVACKPSWQAYRTQAVLAEQAGKNDCAIDCYQRAWALADEHSDLAIEICQYMLDKALYDDIDRFINSLSEETRGHERIQIIITKRAISLKDFVTAEKMMTKQFIGIREGELTLNKIWDEFILAKTAQHTVLSEMDICHIRKNNPLPDNLDFRMTDSC